MYGLKRQIYAINVNLQEKTLGTLNLLSDICTEMWPKENFKEVNSKTTYNILNCAVFIVFFKHTYPIQLYYNRDMIEMSKLWGKTKQNSIMVFWSQYVYMAGYWSVVSHHLVFD